MYVTKCPVCGKVFTIYLKEYQWKINKTKFCSYKCMRKVENEINNKYKKELY